MAAFKLIDNATIVYLFSVDIRLWSQAAIRIIATSSCIP